MLVSTNIHIPTKLYYTKKLEPKTVQKVLGSSAFTVDRLYSIAFDQPTKIDLFESIENPELILSAYVKLNMAYAGAARTQVNNIKDWRILIRRKPSYELRISIYHKQSHICVYTFNHRYTNIDHLHRDISIETDNILEALELWEETKIKNVI